MEYARKQVYYMDFGDSGNKKGYYILDTDTLEYEFFSNKQSPKHIKINLSQLIKFKTITKDVEKIFKGNIIKLVIDRDVSTDDADKLLYRLTQLQSFRLDVDYDVNFNKFETSESDSVDMSSFDMAEAISEFIDILDIKNKSETTSYLTDLYKKYKR